MIIAEPSLTCLPFDCPVALHSEKNTALHWAAYYGLSSMVALLLEYPVPLETPNKHGQCPLHLAEMALQARTDPSQLMPRYPECVRLLTEALARCKGKRKINKPLPSSITAADRANWAERIVRVADEQDATTRATAASGDATGDTETEHSDADDAPLVPRTVAAEPAVASTGTLPATETVVGAPNSASSKFKRRKHGGVKLSDHSLPAISLGGDSTLTESAVPDAASTAVSTEDTAPVTTHGSPLKRSRTSSSSSVTATSPPLKSAKTLQASSASTSAQAANSPTRSGLKEAAATEQDTSGTVVYIALFAIQSDHYTCFGSIIRPRPRWSEAP